jgi:hypothetical protein
MAPTICDFIDDGYTEEAYIAARAGFYGEHRFKYRPMLAKATAAMAEKADRSLDGSIADDRADAIAKHLLLWDMRDSKGSLVPITAANLKRLKPTLFMRLFNLLAGYDPSDADPTAPDPAADVERKSLEADAKN